MGSRDVVSNILKKSGYVAPQFRKYNVTVGKTTYKNISYECKRAVDENRPDKYKPINDDERNLIAAVKKKNTAMKEGVLSKNLAYQAGKKIKESQMSIGDLRRNENENKITSVGQLKQEEYKKHPQNIINSNNDIIKNNNEQLSILEKRKNKALSNKNKSESGKISQTMNTLRQENQKKQAENKALSILSKYNLNKDTFDMDNYMAWAKEHNFQRVRKGAKGHYSEYEPKRANGGFGKKLTTAEEEEDNRILRELAENNQRKKNSKTDLGAVTAAGDSFLKGFTLGGVQSFTDWAQKRDFEKAGFNSDDYVSSKEATGLTKEKHKAASLTGEMGGSLASVALIGNAVGAATGSIKWVSSAPKWVQSALNSGITFAITNGTESATSGGDAKEILKSAGRGLAGGALGGAVSSRVESIGNKLISDSKFRNKIIPEMVKSGIVGSSFAAGKTAGEYWLYPEDYKPTKEEIAKDLAVSFAFSAISSFTNSMKASAQNKKYLDELYQAMGKNYEQMTKANSRMTANGIETDAAKLAEEVIGYSNAMENFLKGKGIKGVAGSEGARFIGQDKYVNSILEELKTVRNAAENVIANAAKTADSPFGSSGKSVSEVTSGIKSISSSIAGNFEKSIGGKADMDKIYSENMKIAETPNVKLDESFVRTYSGVFSDMIKNNNSTAYKVISQNSDNVGDTIADYMLNGTLPEDTKAARAVSAAGEKLGTILKDAAQKNVSAHDSIYGKNTALDDQLQEIQKGNFSVMKNSENVLPEQSENGIIENSNNYTQGGITNVNNRRIETENSQQGKIDHSGNIPENGNRLGETQAQEQTDGIQESRNKLYTGSSGTAQIDGSRQEEAYGGTVETRTLDEIYEQPKFEKLKYTVRNELSAKKHNELYSKYLDDVRAKVGYDFDEIYTYDMLSDPENELRSLFGDNIAEYFNDNLSAGQDITGKNVPENIQIAAKNSVVRNENGNLIPVYHGTDANYKTLKSGDIGIHFGSFAQSVQRVKDKGIENPTYIKAYLNLENPLVIDDDFFGWNAPQIAQRLYQDGILTSEEAKNYLTAARDNVQKSNEELVEILKQKGYDGIIYNNGIEAVNGKSYIVFDDSQILRTDDTQDSSRGDEVIAETAEKPFKQNDIDYSDNRLRKGTYRHMIYLGDCSSEEVSGLICGKYGLHKDTDGNYAATLLSSGMAVARFKTQNEGKQFISYTNENVDFNNVEIIKKPNGTYDINRSDAFLEYEREIKNILKEKPYLTQEKTENTESIAEKPKSISLKRVGDFYEAYGNDAVEIADKLNLNITQKNINGEKVQMTGFPVNILDEYKNKLGNDYKLVTQDESSDIDGQQAENNIPNLTDKCELIATKHTATDENIWVIRLNDRISAEEYKDLKGKVKQVGGYYSRFARTPAGKAIPGFVFKTEPGEKEFKVFNDFFGHENTTDNTKKPETEITPKNKESVENVESQPAVLAEENRADDRGLRAGNSETDVKGGSSETDGIHRDNGGKVLSESAGDDGNGSDVGDDSKRVYRRDDTGEVGEKTDRTPAGDGGRGELLGGRDGAVQGVHREPEQLNDDISQKPETIDTEVKTIEKKRPSNRDNFIITNDVAQEFDNTAPSAKDNIEAIELLQSLENEGRAATAQEKVTLAKYKGWGGIDTRYMPYELNSRFYKLYDYNQRKALQSSQNNAFFTPTKVIDAMYEGLKRMGFRGGNILETSMGVGNFFGRMPVSIRNKSALTGVELESYTARIAQYLYPGATVINKPFQDVSIKNGSYDLIIGNVPFGQNKISYNKKKYSLHNYFVISSLDKVRDGGVVAVITSAGTLDSHGIDARAAIMEKADVVACYKLPEKVFSRNASTDVQTDLLILRKRAANEKPRGDSILNTTTTSDGLRVNEYFVKHPENVLGTLAKGINAWGDITTVLDDGNFFDKLNTAMKKLPKDLISGKSDLKPVENIVSISDKPRFFEKNGQIYADDGAGTATAVSKNQEGTVRDYIMVRDSYKNLLDAYEKDLPEEEIKPFRDDLSKAYDKFYKEHGAVTGDGKKKIGTKKSKNNTFLEADADYYLVSGLERYNSKAAKFEKSALFEKDTLRKKKVTSVDAASDALAVSLNESGRIDFKRMQELTGKTEKQLAEELKGEVVLTPDGNYELTDIYLSGNIYEKLAAVKGKPEFKEQQEMLEKVIPTPKDASSITVKLGANYIEPSYIEQFARDVLNSRLTIRKDVSGRWIIEGVRQARYGDIVNVKYGCNAFNAVQLLEKILNDGEITATKKVGAGDKSITVFDAEMTDIARQKADDIREAFDSWIFRDSERRSKIVDKYNRTYNNYRPLDYKRIAEKLSFDSMDNTLKEKLYPHQKNGIARFLFGGNILFAHGVGTGKTFEMIASVMEARRMGIINKAAIVVPNNKVVDFKNDIAQAYPNAKVLVIDTANKKRQTMLGLVNSNDWDIVLIARTTFTKIPVSRELQANYAAQQLKDLEVQISEAERDRNVSRRQLKGLITQRDNFEQKIKDLNSDTKRDENSVDFEKLGIDCICVDEAHNYKSIMTPSKLDIKGLVNRNNAQMANDMLMKLDYIRSINGRIIFGTGTPITNTVSEIYNMMRMVRPDILEDAGIHSLDEWVNTFAKIESTTEIGIDNQIKTKSTQVIRSFVNASEMVGMFRQFADIVFTKDVVKNLPKAKYIDVEIDGTAEHQEIQRQISEVLAKTKKSELLKAYGQVMAMADAASVDLRMLSGADSDYNVFKDRALDELEYENSKINTMCNIVFDEYKKSDKIKGTQIIFCDKGSGSGAVYSFNLHKDIMQKLIDKGIAKDEIVIIKNQSDAQLEALYDKVNEGEVRVIIGTSQKMAEGLNVQKRVVAIHHPTVTYKPSDWEQGNARGIRAGNINDEVKIYRYLQENTFDSHKWQAQDRKSEMINKALRGETVDEMEDIGADDEGGAGIDAATAMAITSGNPLVKEKIDIDKEVVRLKTLKRNYMGELYRYQDAVAKNPGMISRFTNYADNLKRDIALKSQYKEKPIINIKGKSFEKQTEANKALSESIKSAPKNGQFSKVGTYNGFDIMFKGDTGGMNYSVILKGANEYSVEYAGNGNNLARIAGVLNRLDVELDRVLGRVETLKTDLEFAKKEITKPFEKEKDLSAALEKQKDITYRYEHYGEKTESVEKEENDVIHSSRDIADNGSGYKEYAYKALTNKSDMVVTVLNQDTIYDENGKLNRSDIIDKGIQNVRRKNNPKNTEENAYVYVPDIGRDILVTKDSLRHGLTRNAENTAKATLKIGDILENAVKVNELSPRKNTVGGYVLIGMGIDKNGDYYPTRVVVNNFKIDDIEVLDVLYAAKTKRRTSPQMRQGIVENSTPLIKGSSTISIADLLEIVKNDFSDVLTDDVLDNIGAKRSKSSLSESVVYKDIADNDDTSRWTTGRMTGGSEDDVNISDIVRDIRDKFGIPIATGKVTDREASGIYKEKPETIRTRIANNLPTISHELGHHLNKKYHLERMESVKELRKAVSKEFLDQYPPEAKNGEAVAEFVRIYLKNANDANRLCPDFYSDFVSELSKVDLKAVNEIASSVNKYLSYNISERFDAAIVSSQKKEKPTFKEAWSKLYSDWVDAFHPQKEAVDYVEDVTGKTLSGKKNAYILATNSLNAHTVANFLICEGFRDLDGNIVNAKSFVDSIGMVDSKNVKLLDKYLVLKHSLEWIAPKGEDVAVKRVFADDTLENVDEIKKQIAMIEKEHPEIKTAAKNLYEYQNNVLKYFVIPAGGMTEQTLQSLNKKYPSYVPFYRAVGKKSGMAKGTFANQRSPIMRARGSGELIISPTESIIRNTEKMVKFAMRNQVMSVWADYADKVEGFGQFMEKVPPDMLPHFTNITAQKEQFADALQQTLSSGEDYFAVSNLIDEIFGDAVSDFTPIANPSKKIVTVMRNGKQSYYQIHNEEFYKSVAELSPRQTSGLLRIMNNIMQPMKLLITQNNPIFAATNAMRDFGTAYKLSETNNPVVFTMQYLKALSGIITNSENYKQYKAMGGGHSSELSANIEDISKTLQRVAQKDMGRARRLAYAIFRHPIETVAAINDAVESTPRFAEFQRTLKSGGDLQEAIFNADDITTNFKRSGKGDTAKAVNNLIMFNNAAVQGIDKMFRTITDKDPKKRYKTLLKWLLQALLMGVVGYIYNRLVDEEGYKNLSSYKKNNFYNYAIGDGKFISLPKPRENALLDSFTERSIEFLTGSNKDAFYDFGGYITQQLLPPAIPDSLKPSEALHSVLGSTIFGGLADVGFNEDFKGAPIESGYDQYLPSNERYSDTTSIPAYWLGQTKLARASNVSPKQIDHIISQYTGIIGQVNKALFPMNDKRRDYTIGLRNKFISDSNYSTDLLNKMYDNKDAAQTNFNFKPSINNALEYEENAICASYISNMNKSVRNLPEEQQRTGRAYLLKELNKWNTAATEGEILMKEKLKNDTISDDLLITDLPKSTIEWTSNKVKYAYDMNPKEYTEYVKDYLAAVEKYRKRASRRNGDLYSEALSNVKTEAKKEVNEKYRAKFRSKGEKK